MIKLPDVGASMLMRGWRTGFRSYGLLCVAVLIFSCCLLFTFQRMNQHHAMELLIADNALWRATRAELELERLRHAVDAYALGHRRVDHDDVMQRFDILWSTLPPLLEDARNNSDRLDTTPVDLLRLLDALERIEPELIALEIGDRQAHRRIAYQLTNLAPPLRYLVLEVRGRVAVLSAERASQRHTLYAEQSAYLLGALGSGGLLIGLLFRETRRTRSLLIEARAARARVEHLAHHDPLTHVPNRWLFNDRLTHALRRASRQGELVALHYLDLDLFKRVNDTLGHTAGDQLLIAVAERLQSCLRETDTLARIGGDEFAIVQTGVGDPTGAIRLSERLIAALRPPIELEARAIRVSVSIGVSLYPRHGRTAQELYAAADLALYRAKASGRAAFCLYERKSRSPRALPLPVQAT